MLKRLLPVVGAMLAIAVVPTAFDSADAVRTSDDRCAPGRELPTGLSEHRIQVDGESRSYLMQVPPGYDGSTRTPVVLLFHGYGGDPATILRSTGLDTLADERGFIVVAPQGRGETPETTLWDFRSTIDQPGSDLRFANDLVDEVKDEACVDSGQVFASGFSNGSALALAMACDGTTRIAAYAAVSAPFYETSACGKAPAAPVISFHGTGDSVVAFGGSTSVIGPLPSVNLAAQQWAQHNACPAETASTTVSDELRRFSWDGCRDGSAVDAYAVLDEGHGWPGSTMPSPGRPKDAEPSKVDASEMIWEFFADHPRGGQ